MLRELQRQLAPAGLMLLWLSLLFGLAYPLAVTGLGQALFPHQAQGSLVLKEGRAVGSELVGQPCSDLGHFWSRPSATAPQPYNAAASSGSNLGPSNPALAQAVAENAAALRAAHGEGTVPVELATASASGLDPHLSPAAALYQVRRVAAARGLGEKDVENLVRSRVEERFLGIWGEPRVNVLRLNLALEALPKTR